MKHALLTRFSKIGLLAEKEALDTILSADYPEDICTMIEEKARQEDILLLTGQMLSKFLLEREAQEKKPETTTTPSESQPEPDALDTGARKTRPRPAKDTELSVKVLKNYKETTARATIENFVRYFNSRYEKLRVQFLKRQLENTTSIMHLKAGTKATVIGMVKDKTVSKNGHIIFELEDQTGTIKAILMKKKERLVQMSNEIVFDEVLAVTGAVVNDAMFVDDITFPDIPVNTKPKEFNANVAAAFLSDIHVGSDKFLEKDFERFIAWTNGKIGNKSQKELSAKLGYLLIAGDLVDGIGVYPGQEKELVILDLEAQFEKLAELLSQIPEHIQIIVTPGNHDAVRLAQPQPPLENHFTKALNKLENVITLSNPSMVSLHNFVDSSENGLDVLLYHGTGFDGLIAKIPSLKQGYSRPDLVAKAMLQKRHLSPMHGMDIATETEDNLVIDTLPDVFHSGHVHVNAYNTYRGVKIINSGCWQAQTSYQKSHNQVPTTGRVPIFDFETSQVRQVNFSQK